MEVGCRLSGGTLGEGKEVGLEDVEGEDGDLGELEVVDMGLDGDEFLLLMPITTGSGRDPVAADKE